MSSCVLTKQSVVYDEDVCSSADRWPLPFLKTDGLAAAAAANAND